MSVAPTQLPLFELRGPPAREPSREPPAAPPLSEHNLLREAPEAEPFLDLPAVDPARALRDLPPVEEVRTRAEVLAFRLSKDLGVAVRLSVTDNRSTMVSFRRAPGHLRLRVHHMFLDAPEPVVQAIADYAGRGRRKAGPVLDDYIRAQQPRIRQERHAKESVLNPRGRWFDLRAVFNRLNEEHFQGGIQADIGWGRMPGKRRRKSIRLGVYDHQTREIRIHPALDRPDVPMYFVEFIVFHEMLHQLFPSSGTDGRRVHHPRAFRDREKAFPRYAEALTWEKQNLRVLLRG